MLLIATTELLSQVASFCLLISLIFIKSLSLLRKKNRCLSPLPTAFLFSLSTLKSMPLSFLPQLIAFVPFLRLSSQVGTSLSSNVNFVLQPIILVYKSYSNLDFSLSWIARSIFWVAMGCVLLGFTGCLVVTMVGCS